MLFLLKRRASGEPVTNFNVVPNETFPLVAGRAKRSFKVLATTTGMSRDL